MSSGKPARYCSTSAAVDATVSLSYRPVGCTADLRRTDLSWLLSSLAVVVAPYTAAVMTGRSAVTGRVPSPVLRGSAPFRAVSAITAEPLNPTERKQLSRLRRWGTVGALLLMLG